MWLVEMTVRKKEKGIERRREEQEKKDIEGNKR